MELAILEDDYPPTRRKAIQDAIEMQDLAARQCFDAGIEAPPYKLTELIGKGSFGRVYKAKSTKLRSTVAVKIMSIEEGDCMAPGQSDTFAEILKELTTLRILNEWGAKNVNKIIDSILVGDLVWMVTEYCAGGSVSTLMRPASFLSEVWIIPILREVAEAIYWVHKHGIIHRDLKCANVLITEEGGVQLCDFGVAGIIRSKCEKRSTITGTLQWMAPELFDSNVTYGNEVDIWAFGSMAYEAATGSPPNAGTLMGMDLNRFGAHLRESCPRLEGDEYSDKLKDLISYCMVPDPAGRPRIEDVQKHPYIANTTRNFPTSSLKDLVRSYKKWEKRGGSRQSLFVPGGAECHARQRSGSTDNEGWHYGTMGEADQAIFENHQAGASRSPSKSRVPSTGGNRHRRRLPADIRAMKPPLARVFDPNTLTNYQDQVKAFYKRSPAVTDPQSGPSPAQGITSPVLSMDTANGMAIKESGPVLNAASTDDDDLSSPNTPEDDLNTIKSPRTHSVSVNPCGFPQLQLQFSTSRTQDWTFPSVLPSPTSHPNEEHSQTNSSIPVSIRPSRSRSSSSTLPIGGMDVVISPSNQIDDPTLSRRPRHTEGFTVSSRISLIDLDAGLVALTPPEVTTNSMENERPLPPKTETFPACSSPPTNGTSLPALHLSPFLTSFPFDHPHRDSSSSVSTVKSPMSPTDHASGYNYYQNSDFQPSPLLPSPPNENDPSPPRPTRIHHRRKGSGVYASSSVSDSISRQRARANSSSQSRPSSCCETPPRVADGKDDKQNQSAKNEAGVQKTDPGHRGLLLPRIVLEGRTSNAETIENPYFRLTSPSNTGGPTRGKSPRYGRTGTARRPFEGFAARNANGGGTGNGDNLGKRFMPGPALPQPPRADVMMAMASEDALRDELARLLGSLASHLQHSEDVVMGLPAVGPPRMPKVANGHGISPARPNPSVEGGSNMASNKEA